MVGVKRLRFWNLRDRMRTRQQRRAIQVRHPPTHEVQYHSPSAFQISVAAYRIASPGIATKRSRYILLASLSLRVMLS